MTKTDESIEHENSDGNIETEAGALSIRVLDRTLAVIGFMAETRRQVGITEISCATSLSKATIHRILSTLRDHSVVLKDENGRYQMGPAVLLWADAYRRRSGLAELARPLLRALWERCRETVHLFVYENGDAFYLDKIDSPHPVGMRSRIGARRDLYSTSAGRAILAFLPDSERNAYLGRTELLAHTAMTVTDRAKLEEILAFGMEQGFFEEKEENEEGIRCVGAAILDLRGYPVGAVSVSSPSYRFSDEQSRSIGVFVRDTALAVSRGLGYGK